MNVIIFILLLILKILLILLGAALVLILLILFVPIRYKARGEKLGEDYNVRLSFTWFIKLIHGYVSYDNVNKLAISVKALFVKLYPREKPSDKPDTKSSKKSKTDNDTVNTLENNKAPSDNKAAAIQESITQNNAIEVIEVEETKPSKEDKESEMPAAEDKPHKKSLLDLIDSLIDKASGFFGKIAEFFEWLWELPDRIEAAISDFNDKVTDKKKWVNDKLELIQDGEIRAAIGVLYGEVIRLLKSIRPRSGRAYFRIGFDDPSQTGNLVAVYSILYPYIGKNVHLNAEYEQDVLEGDFYFKGRITIFVLLLIAIRLFINEKVKYLRNKIS